MTIPVRCPIFATRQPLLIAEVREVLRTAGLAAEARVVDPGELERVLDPAENYLLILDAAAVPDRDALARLRRALPGSCFVLWTEFPTADMLQTALECDVHGLLSCRLSREDAARALLRICRGERLFRFDTEAEARRDTESSRLSARERQILMVLADGATNANIAAALHTTEGSIKVCLSRMFRKTGARNRQELASLSRSGTLITEETRHTIGAYATFDAQWMLHEGEARPGAF